MSLIREFERRLETIFEGFFARQFRAGLQPIEIAKKLAREMDANRTISVNRVYAPNDYFVQVSKEDAEKFFAFKDKLSTELSDFLNSHAQSENYALMGYPEVAIEVSDELKLGELRIESSLVERHSAPNPVKPDDAAPLPPRREVPADGTIVMSAVRPKARLVLPNSDKEFALSARTTIGRASENDVVLPDQSISRRHAEIIMENGGESILKDLGSRNGTFLNGERIDTGRLEDGDEVRVGMTTLVFRGGFGV